MCLQCMGCQPESSGERHSASRTVQACGAQRDSYCGAPGGHTTRCCVRPWLSRCGSITGCTPAEQIEQMGQLVVVPKCAPVPGSCARCNAFGCPCTITCILTPVQPTPARLQHAVL